MIQCWCLAQGGVVRTDAGRASIWMLAALLATVGCAGPKIKLMLLPDGKQVPGSPTYLSAADMAAKGAIICR